MLSSAVLPQGWRCEYNGSAKNGRLNIGHCIIFLLNDCALFLLTPFPVQQMPHQSSPSGLDPLFTPNMLQASRAAWEEKRWGITWPILCLSFIFFSPFFMKCHLSFYLFSKTPFFYMLLSFLPFLCKGFLFSLLSVRNTFLIILSIFLLECVLCFLTSHILSFLFSSFVSF